MNIKISTDFPSIFSDRASDLVEMGLCWLE